MFKPDYISGKLRSHSKVGGYPIFYLDEGDCVLCPECATDELTDGNKLSAAALNWESLMYCDQCSTEIESAYGVPEEDADIF